MTAIISSSESWGITRSTTSFKIRSCSVQSTSGLLEILCVQEENWYLKDLFKSFYQVI
jgi:hypothetical protein